MTVETKLGTAEPESEEPKQPASPGVKWKIFVGCLVGAFVLLGVFDLTARVLGPKGDASASAATSPAATHPAAASAASLPAASPIAVAPTPSYPGLFASPDTGPAPRALTVSAIAAFGPEGASDGDNPGSASMALDNGSQPWSSSWYLAPEFGNLQTGTGLLLDMGKTVTVSSVRLALDGERGASVQVRVGDTAVVDDMFVVSSATDVGGTVRLPTQVRASGRYVLIWFTELPSIGHGEYQVSVRDTTVYGVVGST